MKVFGNILKEIGTILVAIIAIVLVWPYFWIGIFPISILTIGVVYNISKPFYDHRKRPFDIRLQRAAEWMLQVLYQLWTVIKYIFLAIGTVIDLFGNVLLGELIEDIVTAEENNMFGMGDVTISAALGDLKLRKKLNKRGIVLCNILSFLDPIHTDHCIAAINLYKYKKELK